jgi:hypothetical protein
MMNTRLSKSSFNREVDLIDNWILIIVFRIITSKRYLKISLNVFNKSCDLSLKSKEVLEFNNSIRDKLLKKMRHKLGNVTG